MLVIGLTGGIGSGKSSVARILSTLGAAVIDTDEIAHRLTEKGTPALSAIIEQFGSSYQLPDGNLDRARLRKRVFSDHAALAKLETLLHPLIKQQVVSEMAEAQGPYLVLVIPLFIETGAYRDLVDRVLVVDCDENQQISRTMSRSQLSAEEVRSIMAQQAPRAERIRQADDILPNRGSSEYLEEYAQELHRYYLTLALQRQA
ncbi:MAG: dephospho-CoA kinase [Betaproteobacteria bacterium CG2_30_59_46]|nr:MAG: dephospho-CoA kinase [Betaproteobacteria bacterium CG2_30_59_46]PIQ14091.1 MAG: dephospho-CoA kinase [Hydrogenophilales bacterium CG18_big_fil_WC_8_21_14_2_50_58_12]PIY01876.1 MAG: dephospho-CoA kinase [Hydrogenophilales bacterium CG_4_10_14_3_um_filter_58_23]PJB07359.1 MAG: dephospho-CoA kinase [Hydrogenophilales bacterium CG_4_9_14_3_um_filter_59_35]